MLSTKTEIKDAMDDLTRDLLVNGLYILELTDMIPEDVAFLNSENDTYIAVDDVTIIIENDMDIVVDDVTITIENDMDIVNEKPKMVNSVTNDDWVDAFFEQQFALMQEERQRLVENKQRCLRMLEHLDSISTDQGLLCTELNNLYEYGAPENDKLQTPEIYEQYCNIYNEYQSTIAYYDGYIEKNVFMMQKYVRYIKKSESIVQGYEKICDLTDTINIVHSIVNQK